MSGSGKMKREKGPDVDDSTQAASTAKSGDHKVNPLSPWTYRNVELFELEYEAFFLRRWQFAGHVNEVAQTGDYMTVDLGRDSVIVVRGKSGQLKAFLNVCRHRGSRLLDGRGTCNRVIRCPYHGWTYTLDGELFRVPKKENFADFDQSGHGLHEIELEVFHGLVFVRIKGDGPTITEDFAHTGDYFTAYGVADYVPCLQVSTQVWNANWKVAWDNYLENYHIPVGHPGLNRLLRETDEAEELPSGVSYGVFRLRDKPSSIDVEQKYQQQFHCANARIPERIRHKWVQFGVTGNLGIDLYPEMLDMFQLVPLGPEKTLIRTCYYGHKHPTHEETHLRELNFRINDPVNEEDRVLCERVHTGLGTTGYSPGPLSSEESSICLFHDKVRELVPVSALRDQPLHGQVAAENTRLLNLPR
jgi:phenylpropionate dioxygenase-like ring-hydroxylating dioxygenase large terminal subunit